MSPSNDVRFPVTFLMNAVISIKNSTPLPNILPSKILRGFTIIKFPPSYITSDKPGTKLISVLNIFLSPPESKSLLQAFEMSVHLKLLIRYLALIWSLDKLDAC